MSPKAGPHEIAMNVVYSVTDTSGQLSTITTSTNATVVGQAGVVENTDVTNIDSANSANPTLTYMNYCNWFGVPLPKLILALSYRLRRCQQRQPDVLGTAMPQSQHLRCAA